MFHLPALRLAKKELASASASSSSRGFAPGEVVEVNESLPYGTDDADTLEPLEHVDDIIQRLKDDPPPVEEEMADFEAP